MRIGVNTRILIEGKLEGVGLFTHEVLRRVVNRMPGDEFVFFFDRPPSEQFLYNDRVKGVILPPQSRHPVLWYWWFERSIPPALRRQKVDLFFSPDGYTSLRSEVPSVLCIHDLAFRHYPRHVPFLVRKYFNHYTPKFARAADEILTVSAFSARDISESYSIDREKITVVGNGVDDAIRPADREQQLRIRTHFTCRKPYLIYIGSVHPRKNVDRLLLAFDLFKERYESDIQLVLAGRWAWKTGSVRKAWERMKHRDAVIRIGHIERGELGRLLAGSSGLVYPSVFEGFGIPVLEAMYAEVPVITSKGTSMQEVAGPAALYADARDVEDLARQMERLARDHTLGAQLVELGRAQRRRYSWDLTADKVVAVLERMKERIR